MSDKVFLKDFLFMAYVWQTEIKPVIIKLRNEAGEIRFSKKRKFNSTAYNNLLMQLFRALDENVQVDRNALYFILDRASMLVALDKPTALPENILSEIPTMVEDVFLGKIDAESILKTPSPAERRQARDRLYQYLRLNDDGGEIQKIPIGLALSPRLDLLSRE